MAEIREYYQRKVAQALGGEKKVSELTESERRHMESSNILVGCILQTLAQNKEEKCRKKKK